MNQPKDLLSIGTFANLTRLSIRGLRLYDELGILQPLHVDPQSGYRYFGVDQLSSARRIRNMRDMDMPLVIIRRVLAGLQPPRHRLNCWCISIWNCVRDSLSRSKTGWSIQPTIKTGGKYHES